MKRDNSGNTPTVNTPGGPGIPGGPVVRDPAKPTVLGRTDAGRRPFLDPRVSDPAAINYAQGAELRRRPPAVAPIPRYADPVAYGPDLPIPLLTSEAGSGTMVEQARQQRGLPMPGVPGLDSVLASMNNEPALGRAPALAKPNLGGAPGIVEGSAHTQPTAAAQPRSAGLSLPVGLLRDDLLPEQATKDPTFQPGQGSMFAVHQPHLADKYGVMRGGKYVPPQMLKKVNKPGQASTLSSDTVDGLNAINSRLLEQKQAEQGPSVDQQVATEASSGPAGGAGSTNKPLSEAEKKALIDDMDEFEMSRLKNALFKDLLNNDEQKRIVEARLTQLDLTELIITGQVRQSVPIVPGVFEPEFQSYAGEEDLSIKRLIGEEVASLKPSDRYILDKYQLMGLTIALVSINRHPFPDYRNADGKFDEEKFWVKYSIVARLNYHMMASLMVNWFWFDMRVRRLFKAEELGNG